MNDQANGFQQIIARCWADAAFKQQFLTDPAGTLAAAGIAVPDGVTVKVMENTAKLVNLVIPAAPTPNDDEALLGVAGGQRVPYGCMGGKMPPSMA
jgi:hypothetical protein